MYGYPQIEEALRKAWRGEEVVLHTTKSESQIAFNAACDIQEKLKSKLGEPKKGASLTIQTHIYDPCEAYFDYRRQEVWNTWYKKAGQYAWSPNSKEKIWTPDNETKQQGRLS